MRFMSQAEGHINEISALGMMNRGQPRSQSQLQYKKIKS